MKRGSQIDPPSSHQQKLPSKNLALLGLSEKLFSSLESPTVFEEIFKITSVPFFIPNFNLLSHELDSFTFKVLY